MEGALEFLYYAMGVERWQSLMGAAIDIALVYYIIYRSLLLIKGTKAVQMLVGILALIVFFFASEKLELASLNWLLDKFIGSFLLVIVVVFQDDIRRGLSQFGRTSFFRSSGGTQEIHVLEEVVKAAQMLASRKLGALIVLERDANLASYAGEGIRLNAQVSKDLLFSTFLPNHQNPLHDGAVIIQNSRVSAAGCFLPLTNNPTVEKTLGTRHRAAIGLSEKTDAVIVVVSEETGRVSVAYKEELTSGLDSTSLRDILHRIFEPAAAKDEAKNNFWERVFTLLRTPPKASDTAEETPAASEGEDT